jgi:acyl-coenzyme A thioesterase PaaI-like protein
MEFVSTGNCFVCGENNPRGLKVKFDVDPEKQAIRARFTFEPTYQGWDGVVHGGLICTLLDEAMANLVYHLEFNAIAASLEVRFKHPTPILQPLIVSGEITEVHKKLVKAKATLATEDGKVLATGISSFLKQTPKQTTS